MSLTGKTNAQKIWNYLIAKGLTPAGTAGLMGNLYAESGFKATNLQNTYEKKLGYTDASYTKAVDDGSYTNFAKDAAGYGLAQWTYHTRKAALLAFAQAAGKSVGDLETQLDFLIKEMSEGYSGLLNTLKTTTSIQTASDLVLTQFERPADMGDTVKAKRAGYGQTYYNEFAGSSAAAEEERYTEAQFDITTPIKTAAQLAAKASLVAKNYKTLYVMGCFGAPMNAANKSRYCANHSYNKAADRTAMIQAASADTFGFDCVCLIKGLLWGWKGDTSKTYGGASYAANDVPDIGADSMIKVCSDVSTDFSNVEVGEAVWCEGHIGIYIGNGLAVECTPRWKNCVQITACNCDVTGYNRRNWTKHGKLPYVTYDENSTEKVEDTKSEDAAAPKELKVGDIVTFTGTKHYANSNAATGPACKPGKAKITAINAKGKHPYHLIRVSGGGSTVYGWVDTNDIEEAARVEATQPEAAAKKTSWEIGDEVDFTGTTHYASSNATRGVSCKPGKAKITAIYAKGKHPYHLIRVSGGGSTVYGWVDASTFGADEVEDAAEEPDPDDWDSIKYFKKSEFACKCGRYCDGYPAEVDMTMVKYADAIRARLGVPVSVNSGLRCKQHNANVGGVSNSQHLYGGAADLGCPAGKTVAQMVAAAEAVMGDTGGIGTYSWGIHIDSRKTKSRWNG